MIDIMKVEVVTKSQLRSRYAEDQLALEEQAARAASGAGKGAEINERCPKCDADTLSFHTMQTRSADEGASVFYTCHRCGYKDKLNT